MRIRTILPLFFFSLFLLPGPLFADSETRLVSVSVSADSENADYEAYKAMDGDPETLWHSQYQKPAKSRFDLAHPISCGYSYACGYDHSRPPQNPEQTEDEMPCEETWNHVRRENGAPLPHELRIDLGDVFPIEGFTYIPRKNWDNGTIERFEVYAVEEEARKNGMGPPVHSGIFLGNEPSFRVDFDSPVSCRFFKLVALSERNEKPFTSIAELQLHVPGVRFQAVKTEPPAPGSRTVPRRPDVPGDPALQERADEWNLLAERFKTPAYWKAIENEVYDQSSLIRPEDRDPLDIVLRRIGALREHLPLDPGESHENILREAAETPVEDHEKRFDIFCRLASLRASLLFQAPGSLADRPGVREFLFVKRHRSNYQHMCDQFYGRTQRPGGGLYVLRIPEDGDFRNVKVRDLLKDSTVQNGRLRGQKLRGGSFLSPDVSFDGGKIAFAYVQCTGPEDHYDHLDVSRGHWDIGRSYHIFTCNADGSDLRQITDGTWNDFDPCWLPNGRLAFISERRNGYLRCGRECPTYTLYDMNPDGSKMRCLSYHETNEWNPSVTHDGKILYTRWDYVDRYGCIAHHPWITTLDGRSPRQVHGNYSHRHRRADVEFDCRAVPDSPKYIATGGPHHGQSFGSLLLIDPWVQDDDAMGPTRRITPDVGFPESQGGGEVFGTPWALSERFFLCTADFSFQPGAAIPGAGSRGNDGIYLCDVYGNRELIYRDPKIACISPMPLAARPSPSYSPDLIDPADIEHQPYVGLRDQNNGIGTMMLLNVYDSYRPFPESVKIKELRIIQLLPMSVPSRDIRGQRTGIQEASSLDSVNIARSVLGTVPVEEDGSAHFELPARIEFQFQALDESGRAVQSMRSSSYLQPGENLSCNGCHEPNTTAPSLRFGAPQAFKRPASKIQAETAPGTNPFSYPLLVQPILDKHCVDCHEKSESQTFRLSREPIRDRFYESYNNLAAQYGFTDYKDPLRTTPGRFGASASPLDKILREGHYEVKLSEEEMHRIVLWLDCLSMFYGVYEPEAQERQLRGERVRATLE